ncbi:MAG: hypothetical protein EOP00_16985 [Pedobacter sp.]|nr:MAG: hypothetical protein EOP00_16985 [Pedobacter sp.]
MENKQQNQSNENLDKQTDKDAKVKENTYTPEEKEFADGEGTKLDDAIDSDEANPATRGE